MTSTTLGRQWTFLNLSVRNLRSIGALMPSSRRLGEVMAEQIADLRPTVIVELGAGTGALTGALLDLLPPDGRLLAFEVEPDFHDVLRRRFQDPRLHLVARSAEFLLEELARLGLHDVPCVVSGLPFQSLPEALGERILAAVCRGLAPGGRFVAFQYAPLPQSRFRRHFPKVRVARRVWRNLPPALVVVGEV